MDSTHLCFALLLEEIRYFRWIPTWLVYLTDGASPPWNAANLSTLAVAFRADALQTRWHCEDDGLYLLEPTGDAVFFSTNSNATRAPPSAVRALHAPDLLARLERCASNATEQAELCTQGSCANTSIEVASAMTCSADDDFDQARNHMPAGEDHRPASVLGAPAWALSGA